MQKSAYRNQLESAKNKPNFAFSQGFYDKDDLGVVILVITNENLDYAVAASRIVAWLLATGKQS